MSPDTARTAQMQLNKNTRKELSTRIGQQTLPPTRRPEPPSQPQGLRELLEPKIFEKDIHKYGASPGCSACTEIILGQGGRKAAQSAVAHSDDCTARMREAMRNDPVYVA